MGAQLWHHQTTWHPDPEEALRQLQAQFLDEHYELGTLLQERLDSARQAVESAQAEGDPYDLVDVYQQELERLQWLSAEPVPEDPLQQIEVLRRIEAGSGQGIGNILDVTGISESRGTLTAEQLSESELMRLVGTARPTTSEARQALDAINSDLGRGQSVCFPVYGDSGEPVGWYFVGNTID